MIQAITTSHSVSTGVIRVMEFFQRAYMRLISYFSPVKDCYTVFGSLMRCRTRDFLQRRIRFFGIFEHNLTYYTLERLKDGDVYLDIGANAGYFTLLASRCVGSTGKVISIEADPATFQLLTKNLELNDCCNVLARNVAATAGVCRVTMKRGDAYNSGSNSIEVKADQGYVHGLPFRNLAEDYIGRIRFIKIDIEGSEGPVLEAILESLAELPDDVIIASEISSSSASYIERFSSAGFQAYALQNIYGIDYYLIRSYMRSFGEEQMIYKHPVSSYDSLYNDYVFERGAPIVGAAAA